MDCTTVTLVIATRLCVAARVALGISDGPWRARVVTRHTNLLCVVVHVSIAHWRGSRTRVSKAWIWRVDHWRSRLDTVVAQGLKALLLVRCADSFIVVHKIQSKPGIAGAALRVSLPVDSTRTAE